MESYRKTNRGNNSGNTPKRWLFWLGLILLFVTCIFLALLIPYSIQTRPDPREIIILAAIFTVPGGIGLYLLVRRTGWLVHKKLTAPEKIEPVMVVTTLKPTLGVKRTWMPVVAGVLDLIFGGFAITFFISGIIKPDIWTKVNDYTYYIIGLCSSVLAITGGIHALLRRRWLLALVGSICSLFPEPLWFIVLGFTVPIFAIVLTVLSKKEFISAK